MRFPIALTITLAAIVAAGFAVQAPAQQPVQTAETRQARGKRVVEEAVQALGGAAFLSMRDRTEEGEMYSFDGAKLSGRQVVTIYTRYLPPAPGKFAVKIRQIFGKNLDEGGFLCIPDGAWDISFRGARPLDDAALSAYQQTTIRGIFYILRQRLQEPEISFYSQGGDFFEHQPVEIVDITDAGNTTITVYFDRNTHLPLRQQYRKRNQQFNDFDTEVTGFGKYHSAGAVTLPMETRRERNGQKIFEIFLSSAQVNTGVKEDLFVLPANLKVIQKK